MKRILFLIVASFGLTANAQDYYISFGGTGAASTVDSVKVENLMTGTSLTLKGDEILHLTGTVGIQSSESDKPLKLEIYPNPMNDYSMIEISPPVSGEAVITVLDMTGRQFSQTQKYLYKSRQELRLSGLKNGFYLINIRGNNYQYSGKILCTGQSDGILSLELASNKTDPIDIKSSNMGIKGSQDGGYVVMIYMTGDRLKYTGYSGTYGTVTTEIATGDKTISFVFVPCTTGGHNYLTMQIGTKTWMANNLNTFLYNDGSSITLGPVVASSTPAYCYYNGNIDFLAFYGALYNWHAVNTLKLCPVNWHVASNLDWSTLASSIGGQNVASGKLKETGIAHWLNPNYGATNELGFTALPGGSYMEGSYRNLGAAGYWWNFNEIPGGSFAYYRSMYNTTGILYDSEYMLREYYFSVRCVKN